MTTDRYTCMSCNKGYDVDDPAFVYWRQNQRGENLDGRDGRARSGLGWFAHCADTDACANRRRNLHAGLPAEQMTLCAR
ncbi:MAG: hypothetical protein ACJ780_10065 [Solirubrobacteraceae bacterium]|jgi:hypothetical protein